MQSERLFKPHDDGKLCARTGWMSCQNVARASHPKAKALRKPIPIMPVGAMSAHAIQHPQCTMGHATGNQKKSRTIQSQPLACEETSGAYYRISPTRVNNNLFDASPLPFQGLGGTTCERVPVHVCVTKVQPSLRFQLRPSGDQARQSDQLHFDTSFVLPKTKRARAVNLTSIPASSF